MSSSIPDACTHAFRSLVLDPLEAHTSPGGALITLGSSGTHYDLAACQLEAFARPLWGLVSLLEGGGQYPGVNRWVKGLVEGTKKGGSEYWGETKGKGQLHYRRAVYSSS